MLAVGEDEKAISIHAPREGCDVAIIEAAAARERFQSTHPARGATPCPEST